MHVYMGCLVVSLAYAKVLTLIGQFDLGQVWVFLSREERVAECKEEKLSEEGRVFWLWWVSGSYAEWPSFFWVNVDIQWVVMPNGHPFFWFNVDIQWVSGGPAEWSSPFSTVQCLMFKGSRVVSRMIIFFVQCLTFNGCRAIKSCRMAISFIVQYWCRVSLVLCCFFCIAIR